MKKKIEYKELGTFGITPISILHLVTGNELKAYIALASFQGTGEHCWPGLDQIAVRSSLTPQGASEAITGLVKKGLAIRKRNYGKTNTYRVLVPTRDPEIDSYPENPDNKENSVNKGKSDVDYPKNPDDDYPKKSDDIGKEHIKITKEKNTERESVSQKVDDPFDAIPLSDILTINGDTYNEENVKFVIDHFNAYLLKEYKRKPNRIDKLEANRLYNLLVTDDKAKELDEIIMQYEYSWSGRKSILAKKADSPTDPTPRRILDKWDSLNPDHVPLYARKGYKTESEMTFALRREREQIADIQRQTRVKTVVDEGYREQVIEAGDQLLEELEQMKKEFA
jgi:hypothetical protein